MTLLQQNGAVFCSFFQTQIRSKFIDNPLYQPAPLHKRAVSRSEEGLKDLSSTERERFIIFFLNPF